MNKTVRTLLKIFGYIIGLILGDRGEKDKLHSGTDPIV